VILLVVSLAERGLEGNVDRFLVVSRRNDGLPGCVAYEPLIALSV
jgi:hypothetical protein